MLHQLGSGVLGPVFRAHDSERDRLVAVKVFRLDLTPELADEVGDDLQALVRHWPSAMPGLVRPVRAGVEYGTPWLAQEFAPGEGLDAILRPRTRPSVDEVVSLVARIADALDAASADGWTHGALHPRDILVTQDLDGIAITGVGIAHVVERAGFRAPRRRPYVAPERVAGHGWDARADIYSLAVITLELIGSRRASSGGHLAVSTVIEEAGLDVELWSRALTRALAEDPTQRFETARAFADALDAACSSEARAPRLPLEDEEAALDVETAVPPVEELALVDAAAARDAQATTPDVPLAERHAAFDFDTDAATPGSAQGGSLLDDPMDADGADDLRVERDGQPGDVLPAPLDVEPDGGVPWPPDGPASAWQLPAPGDRPTPARPYGLLAATLGLGLFIGFLAGAWFMRGGAFTASSSQREASSAVPVTRADVVDEPVVQNDVVGQAAPSAARPAPAVPAPSVRASSAPGQTATTSRPANATRGVMRVTSSPGGARVTVDGRARGTTPLVLRDLALGTYRLGLSREGFEDRSTRVTLSDRRPDATVEVTLPRVPARRAAAPPAASAVAATIIIATRPSGAQVFVDGRAVGTSPVTVPGLAPGSHQIRLELPGHRPWTTAVDVTPNQTRRVSASLEPTGTR